MGRLRQRARSLLRGPRGAAEERSAPADSYEVEPPSAQTALDVFAGRWTSRLPPPLEDANAGTVPLFADVKLDWGIEELGGVTDASVLECGPLEGGHTYTLLQHDARKVVAVEANRQAFLRCLVVKELLGLDRAQFLCGDIVRFLDATTEHFDVCIAAGVLYHMENPVELIELTSRVADRLYLWTHYWDEASAAAGTTSGGFTTDASHEHRGFRHTLHRHDYGAGRQTTAFLGGSGSAGNWLSRSDLLGGLDHFGWRVTAIGFEDRAHPNGPSLALVAQRTTG
jgi:Protein of unknown function (DUF1698)